MAKFSHYSPQIDRFLVSVLYYDARSHGKPMTKRLDQLLRESLQGSEAWKEAEKAWSEREKTTQGSLTTSDR